MKLSLNVSKIWARGAPLHKEVKKPKSGLVAPRNSLSSGTSAVYVVKSEDKTNKKVFPAPPAPRLKPQPAPANHSREGAREETLRLLQKDIADLEQAIGKYNVAIDEYLGKINALLSAKLVEQNNFTPFCRKDFGISDGRITDNEDTVMLTLSDEIAESTLKRGSAIFVCSHDAEKETLMLDCEKKYYLRELDLRKETLGSLKAVYKSY
jgi:hypothetical protein